MAEELKVKIVGEIPEGAERSSVRARFAQDAAQDAEGQGGRYGYLKPTVGDAEGQGIRYSGFKAEGQAVRKGDLTSADDEDATGHGGYYKGFVPVEAEDTEGNALKSHVLEIERDENGQLVGRYVPAGDDTQGQGLRLPPKRERDPEEDVEGHRLGIGSSRPPVD